MKIRRVLSATNSRVPLLITFLLTPIAGCDDSTVSPCFDCSSPGDGRFTEVTEQSFAVDEAATITVDSFVGKVAYRTGETGSVRVKATKRAAYRDHLNDITVEMTSHRNELVVQTGNPEDLKRVSVDLEITAPPDARPQVTTGVGAIDYRGRPRGLCRFAAGVGAVRLRLDADISVTVALTAGVGSIVVSFPVDGSVHRGSVMGRIGRGDEGNVRVSTGVGSIYLIRQ